MAGLRRAPERTARGLLSLPSAPPLLRGVDHGQPVIVDAQLCGFRGERWVEPFLEANRPQLDRLDVTASIQVRGVLQVSLQPGTRIGAVPLISPTTRRVAAGLLVSPRFRWSALGAVLGKTGFATEPSVGGPQLVPGSARDVPAWLLASPVVKRLEEMLRHRARGFTELAEERGSPRGRIDWTRWARTNVPRGRLSSFPCTFPDPSDDPELLAAVRWTLSQLDDQLAVFTESTPARLLRYRVGVLQTAVGPGVKRRPLAGRRTNTSAWVADALEAMSWVADERGLGGAQALDGMSWDLRVDELWEAWVDTFIADLAPRAGLSVLRRGTTRQRLNWRSAISSMRSLVPDSGLRSSAHTVWVDAKYKPHLQELAARGWSGLSETMRDEHRADLHQALAYAALNDTEHVDSLLVYPALSSERVLPPAVATVPAGRRRVRLVLVSLPFGFRSETHREETLSSWRSLLAA